MLLLAALALLQFLRLLDNSTLGNCLLLGGLVGLGYLAKEPAILLLPAFWIYLLLSPADRPLLRRPGWYLAHAAVLLVMAPDLAWNAAQGTESYLYRDLALASEPLRLSLKPLSLYLGEWFHRGALAKTT